MVVKSQVNWNVKQLVKLVQAERVTFDNVVQRGYSWEGDTQRQSLYIHSILIDYPVPPFYAIKEDTKYDMLDGQQRSRTATDFFEGKFALIDVPEIEVRTTDGEYEYIDVNGMKYEDLPEDLRDKFDSYAITVNVFDKCITDDEIADMFFRLNNGMPLTAVELTRVKAKSIHVINELALHELFTSTLTEKQMKKYTHEDLVMKTYAMLYSDELNLTTKYLRPYIIESDITEEDKTEMKQVFDRMFNVYNAVAEKSKKIANKFIKRTHLVTLAPIFLHSINSGYSEKDVQKWIESFFTEGRSTTISATYNENARGNTNSKTSVKKRLDAANDNYKAYMKKLEKEKQKNEEAKKENSTSENEAA